MRKTQRIELLTTQAPIKEIERKELIPRLLDEYIKSAYNGQKCVVVCPKPVANVLNVLIPEALSKAGFLGEAHRVKQLVKSEDRSYEVGDYVYYYPDTHNPSQDKVGEVGAPYYEIVASQLAHTRINGIQPASMQGLDWREEELLLKGPNSKDNLLLISSKDACLKVREHTYRLKEATLYEGEHIHIFREPVEHNSLMRYTERVKFERALSNGKLQVQFSDAGGQQGILAPQVRWGREYAMTYEENNNWYQTVDRVLVVELGEHGCGSYYTGDTRTIELLDKSIHKNDRKQLTLYTTDREALEKQVNYAREELERQPAEENQAEQKQYYEHFSKVLQKTRSDRHMKECYPVLYALAQRYGWDKDVQPSVQDCIPTRQVAEPPHWEEEEYYGEEAHEAEEERCGGRF